MLGVPAPLFGKDVIRSERPERFLCVLLVCLFEDISAQAKRRDAGRREEEESQSYSSVG
jgi:hypothetical protein